MARDLRVLLDLNIVLDVLSRREPGYRDSAAVWALVETGRMEGVVAAHSLTTLFYLMSRGLPRNAARRMIVDGFLEEVLSRFALESVTEPLRRRINAKLGDGTA